ncbi:MAG: hypothetical protein QXE12_03850 [Conexivisphaerales archaeon]
MISLDEAKVTVLDILLNVGRVEKTEFPSFFVNLKTGSLPSNDKILESVEVLKKKKYVVEKNNVLMIDPQNKDNVIVEVRSYLDGLRINSQRLYDLSERLDFRIPWFLASVNMNNGLKRITFSDNFNDINVMSLCMDLVSAKLAFQYGKDYGNHHILTFYLRRYPFDVVSILQDEIEKVVKKDILQTYEDMVIAAMTVFMDSPLTMADFKVNLPDLTTEHLSEAVSKLAQRGLLYINDGKIGIKEEIRSFFQGYFVWNYARKLNMTLFNMAKDKLNNRASNFYYFGFVKRILSGKSVQTISPYFLLDKDALKDVDDEELAQAVKLGFLFVSSKQIMLNTSVISGIEGIMKESLRRGSLLSIRAPNAAETNTILAEVLSQPSSELRIQDPEADEETLRILLDYIDPDTNLMLLFSIKRPSECSVQMFINYLDQLKERVKSLEVVFVGNKNDSEAPFHNTYIINDVFCVHLSHPIRETGKVEETYVSVEPLYEKNGIILPAFDMLFRSSDKDWLERRNLVRLSWQEWLNLQK